MNQLQPKTKCLIWIMFSTRMTILMKWLMKTKIIYSQTTRRMSWCKMNLKMKSQLWFNTKPSKRKMHLQRSTQLPTPGSSHSPPTFQAMGSGQIITPSKTRPWRIHQTIFQLEIQERATKASSIKAIINHKIKAIILKFLLCLRKQWVEIRQNPWQRRKIQVDLCTRATSGQRILNQEEIIITNRMFRLIKFRNS